MADQLATRTDLAALVQADVDNASADLALEIATSIVQAAVGQRLIQAGEFTEVVYGGTDRTLVLSQRPVGTVTSVSYNGTVLTAGTASGTYRLTPDGLWRDIGWTDCAWEPWPVTVVYTPGYPDGSQDLELARGVTLSLARGLFVNPSGAVREQIDDYAVAYSEAAAAFEALPSLLVALRRKYGRKAGMVRVL